MATLSGVLIPPLPELSEGWITLRGYEIPDWVPDPPTPPDPPDPTPTPIFAAIPALAANGSGAPVDVSTFGASKTFIVSGSWVLTPSINIEISSDPAQLGGWQSLKTLQGSGSFVVNVACHWIRVTVANFRGGVAPTVSVGGLNSGTHFAALPAAADSSVGAPVDVSTLALFKTIQVGGTFRGSLIVEASTDGGATYATVASVQAGAVISQEFTADFMRTSRVGVPQNNPGLPIVNIAACAAVCA